MSENRTGRDETRGTPTSTTASIMALAAVQLPAMAWNCHMHSLDPVAHPFKPTRSYTPKAAHAPVRRLSWLVTSQLSLVMWTVLADFMLNGPLLAGAVFVADHNDPARARGLVSADLDTFLRLLRSSRFYIKVGALQRRSPVNLATMRSVIEASASAAPDARGDSGPGTGQAQVRGRVGNANLYRAVSVPPKFMATQISHKPADSHPYCQACRLILPPNPS